MLTALRGPPDRVNTPLVPLQLSDRHRGRSNVENHNLVRIHQDRRHVPEILLVPREPQERRVGLGALVDDGGVLLVAEVEDSHGSVGGDGGEDPGLPPGDVVDLLVVRDELRLNDGALHVPDGARGVDAARAEAFGLDVVPVEGGQRGAELGRLAVVEDREGLRGGGVGDLPEAEEVAGGGEEVAAEGGRAEHELGGRVGVVEGEGREGFDGHGVGIEGEDVDAVVVVFEEASDGDSVGGGGGGGGGEGHGVEGVRRFVGDGGFGSR